MYKQFRFLITLLLLAVCGGTWAEEVTAKFDLTLAMTSPCTVNGATITWSSANFVTGATNATSNGFKSNSNVTLTLPSGATLTKISKTNGSNWGSGATVLVYAGSSTSGTQIASIVTGTNSYTISSNNTGGTFYLSNSTSKNAWLKDITITYTTSEGGGGDDSDTPTVTFNPAGGTYDGPQTISLSTNVSASNYPYIYYTFDGTDPTDDNYEGYYYNGTYYDILDEETEIVISSSCTLKARVYDSYDWDNPSEVFTATYTIAQATKYTVTIETPQNGTLVIKNGETTVSSGEEFVAGTVLTAVPTPAEGYRLKNWQAVDATTHTYTANYTYTMGEHDVTFKANFEEIPQYVYQWSVNGTVVDSQTLDEGAAVTFPTANVPSYSDKVFVGWVTTETVESTTAPAFVTTSGVTATANTTYYAVFATQEADGEPTYEKLASQNFEASATYVLGAKQSSTDDTMWYLSSYSNTDVNVDWGEMTTTPADALTFTLSGTANELVARDSNGNYLDHGVKKFKMSTEPTTSILTTSGSLQYTTSSKNYTLRHNYNNGSGGLRWYDSTTGTVANFYKVISGTTYSDYCTTISPTVTVSSAGYATYVAADNVTFPTEVTAYIVTDVTASSIKLQEVLAVEKDVPVIVKATAGTYDLEVVTADDCDDVTDNQLQVSDGTLSDNLLVLANKSNGVGFYRWIGGLLPAGKVYLVNPNSSREFFGFGDGEATGIEHSTLSIEHVGDVYNMQGQRVDGNYKGIVIVNGKKYMNK